VARRHPLLVALQPVADAVGATVVARTRLAPSDIPLEWDGEVVGGLRLPDRHVAIEPLIAQVERELGARLAQLSRVDKQHAVRLLEERGAFTLRKSIDDVADALGVSRITVYNYLHAIREGSIAERSGRP
jgi:CRP-like cAMP-binding protein